MFFCCFAFLFCWDLWPLCAWLHCGALWCNVPGCTAPPWLFWRGMVCPGKFFELFFVLFCTPACPSGIFFMFFCFRCFQALCAWMRCIMLLLVRRSVSRLFFGQFCLTIRIPAIFVILAVFLFVLCVFSLPLLYRFFSLPAGLASLPSFFPPASLSVIFIVFFHLFSNFLFFFFGHIHHHSSSINFLSRNKTPRARDYHPSVLGERPKRKKLVERAEFFWPGLQADAKRFITSCDSCQRTTPRGHTRKVPLVKVPFTETPFHRVTTDIVGPLNPMSDQENDTCQQWFITPPGIPKRLRSQIFMSDQENDMC